MIVCLCNTVSDRDIRQAASEGASTLQHLSERFNLGMCCGACKQCAADCLDSAVNAVERDIQPSVSP
ncbi:MAG TPA: (2Fe-2S)-binding protein [Gammaproteobacteria bacterium]|nr:(2Fe-2S)-binding protein [Gammaproteobacteria bacterium]